jgi:hypothetical protein
MASMPDNPGMSLAQWKASHAEGRSAHSGIGHFRCPECRTRRRSYGLFLQHLVDSGHRPCQCGGYHYKHRPGSPCCHKNPLAVLHIAARQSNSEEELITLALSIAHDHPELAEKVEAACYALDLRLAA